VSGGGEAGVAAAGDWAGCARAPELASRSASAAASGVRCTLNARSERESGDDCARVSGAVETRGGAAKLIEGGTGRLVLRTSVNGAGVGANVLGVAVLAATGSGVPEVGLAALCLVGAELGGAPLTVFWFATGVAGSGRSITGGSAARMVGAGGAGTFALAARGGGAALEAGAKNGREVGSAKTSVTGGGGSDASLAAAAVIRVATGWAGKELDRAVLSPSIERIKASAICWGGAAFLVKECALLFA